MAVITLPEAKADLRIYGDDDDANLTILLNAAIASAANYICRPIPWTNDAGQLEDVPEDVNAAILLELRALHDDPEKVHSAAFKVLLNPYRVY
jgi:hypothetical protein